MGPSAERMGTVRQLFSFQAIMVSRLFGSRPGSDTFSSRGTLCARHLPLGWIVRQGHDLAQAVPARGVLLPHRPRDDRVDLVHVLIGHAFTHTERRGGAAGDDDERVLEFVGARDGAARFEHRRQPGGLRLLGGQSFGVLN